MYKQIYCNSISSGATVKLSFSNSEKKLEKMIDFVKIFGTHYNKAVNFGAVMVYERRFSSASKTEGDKQTRKDCTGTASSQKF